MLKAVSWRRRIHCVFCGFLLALALALLVVSIYGDRVNQQPRLSWTNGRDLRLRIRVTQWKIQATMSRKVQYGDYGHPTINRAFGGFGYTASTPYYPDGSQWYSPNVFFPIWFAEVLLLWYPTLVFFRSKRTRMPVENVPRCACGYCLTGNVSGICPECGRILPQLESQ